MWDSLRFTNGFHPRMGGISLRCRSFDQSGKGGVCRRDRSSTLPRAQRHTLENQRDNRSSGHDAGYGLLAESWGRYRLLRAANQERVSLTQRALAASPAPRALPRSLERVTPPLSLIHQQPPCWPPKPTHLPPGCSVERHHPRPDPCRLCQRKPSAGCGGAHGRHIVPPCW